MKVVRFELNDAAAKLFAHIQNTDEFLEVTPKVFFVKSMRAFMQRDADAVEARKEKPTAQKAPPIRETAAEKLKREQAAYREARCDEYRASGEWPRVHRYKNAPGEVSAFKDGQVKTFQGEIMFVFPGRPDSSGGFSPPEDYPYMEEYLQAQREVDALDLPPVDPNYPKLDDYETSEEYYAAENAYLIGPARDAIDALPDPLPDVYKTTRTPAIVTDGNLHDELLVLFGRTD